MQVSVASGKGGTGKTTIATHLAVALARAGRPVTYVDCDVEEPDGHLFLRPEVTRETEVTVPVPQVNLDKCTLCGDCSAGCEFHALAVLGETVKVFPALCHGCGGCRDICQEEAIIETPRVIGTIRHGRGMGTEFLEGRLKVGEALSPPVTRALKKLVDHTRTTIIDAPPGTSCPVIEAISGSDFVVLVSEPTPFGLNDLELAVGMVREMGLPFGVVINRADIGDHRTEAYCRAEDIDIILKLPFDRQLAEVCSRGAMMFEINPGYERRLNGLYGTIAERVNHD